jgi:ABC-type multidrug transport system ATPase subunit
MNHFIIETVGLRRNFGSHMAVDRLDLTVPQGSIFGFLGRNGAGKTATIRLLLGFLKSGGGEVRVFNEVVTGPEGNADLRRRIGYVSESKYLYPYMTIHDRPANHSLHTPFLSQVA